MLAYMLDEPLDAYIPQLLSSAHRHKYEGSPALFSPF